MTISEFQAWLEGYSASFGEAPSADQWAEIKGRIARLQVVSFPPTREWTGAPIGGCACPPGTICNSIVCPRGYRVTSPSMGASGSATVGGGPTHTVLRPDQLPSQTHGRNGGWS
jgi:hypothetical protein